MLDVLFELSGFLRLKFLKNKLRILAKSVRLASVDSISLDFFEFGKLSPTIDMIRTRWEKSQAGFLQWSYQINHS